MSGVIIVQLRQALAAAATAPLQVVVVVETVVREA
jgi:hypothetical protein